MMECSDCKNCKGGGFVLVLPGAGGELVLFA